LVRDTHGQAAAPIPPNAKTVPGRLTRCCLDLQHAVFMQLLKGKLGLAPIEKPHYVLDLGTGTSDFAAASHPVANVLSRGLTQEHLL
jgi:hypothetical protein